jgi:hypothetical protein
VNWQHFQTFLWLRGRLFVNQMKRGGMANAIILGVMAVCGGFFAAGLFVTFLLVGLFALPEASPAVLLYVWDGLVFVFLFFWVLGLLMELQRSEVLSLDKFLHLPVSLRGAFLINYLSSLFNLTLFLLLPGMIALSLALVIVKGPALLMQFPLLAAFVFMATAVTYQFQGWLASLMVNKRRRRTVIVVVTMVFVLLLQLPNLVNIMRPWEGLNQDQFAAQMQAQQAELQRQLQVREIDAQEYHRRLLETQQEYHDRTEEASSQLLARVERVFRLVNMVFPPGWLPLGTSAAAEGSIPTALLCAAGMTLIGGASLWRAYRTTLRLYTGQVTSGKRAAAAPAKVARPAAGTAHPSAGLMERRLPWVPERAAAVALSSLCSLLRAPEAKMMLLSPLILVVIFGSLFLTRSANLPVMTRPLVAFGTMLMILLTTTQIAGNLFGFDRGGFRVFVLSAAPRRDILLGKNLAFAPLALGLGLLLLALLQVVQPLRLEHFVAAVPQFVFMYLPFCLLANFLSIFAPMPIRSGSFKPMNPKGMAILLHLAFAFLTPLVLAPALLPLGAEFALEELGEVPEWVPICLVLSLLECVAAVYIYRLILGWQGSLLQARERKILELVTTRAE